ncbi:MAG: Bug family tripartite tricarboxylate transporter substrate binding protein [Beijerinckiaceae bacterium]
MNTKRKFPVSAAIAAGTISAIASVSTVSAQDFYAGKTISMLVSSDPGGGYDTYARLLARHYPKYIPGSPTIVVQNQPGGGGLRAAQQTFTATPDGTRIGNLRASTLLDSILGIRGMEIQPTAFEWIGNMASDTDLCSFWHTAGVKTFEDLRNKEILVGGSGKGAQNYSFTNAINSVLGTKMKIILGYKGMGDRILALERGELQGNCGTNSSSIMALHPQLIAEGKLIPIMQSGLRPYSAFPNVPLTQSFARNEREKQILVTIFSQMDIARIFAAPPKTPGDRLKILRDGFMKAMADPELIAEAKKQRMDLDPMDHAEVAKVVAAMSNIPEDMKQEVRKAIGE